MLSLYERENETKNNRMTLLEWLNGNELSLDILRKYSDGFDFWNGKAYELIKLPWWDVKENIPEALKKSDFEGAISIISGQHRHDILKVDISKRLNFIIFVINSIEKIYDDERKYLSRVPDSDLVAAGIRELDKFGNESTLFLLCDGDPTRMDYVRSSPYELIFDWILYRTINDDISKKLAKIKKNKKSS